MSAAPVYAVSAADCLRCGACSTLAPALFAMGERAVVLRRQPLTREEHRLAEAALCNCPVLAIRKRSTHER